MVQCKAKSKRTKEQCQANAVTGKDVCYHHGGKTPVKHGLYSKYTKHKLGDKIQELASDPGLLDLRQQIAFKQSLILDKLDQLQGYINSEDSEMLTMISEKVSRDIERLHKLENGEKYVLQIEEVQAVVNQIVIIIREEVQDQALLERLAGKLQEVRW